MVQTLNSSGIPGFLEYIVMPEYSKRVRKEPDKALNRQDTRRNTRGNKVMTNRPHSLLGVQTVENNSMLTLKAGRNLTTKSSITLDGCSFVLR